MKLTKFPKFWELRLFIAIFRENKYKSINYYYNNENYFLECK